ncbi:hypothetical protein HETIRDRAFT_164960 [Heterobasidion irregulare TC 32-1]|uniref:Uncharacterized protein n=1 Tax=Heterobasidion irregulare (strain TC 32-1) TaxID=747525 RepID=W4JMY2_HETIT|nr:uncharacterized protein HETIRDRAFT_164960 [Heterobasidion irregulare TC 32-1]ETW74819.1 hypothetical protein HETIRDRAFT_164960 [Heterobasidion irregulare TC 32-1]
MLCGIQACLVFGRRNRGRVITLCPSSFSDSLVRCTSSADFVTNVIEKSKDAAEKEPTSLSVQQRYNRLANTRTKQLTS